MQPFIGDDRTRYTGPSEQVIDDGTMYYRDTADYWDRDYVNCKDAQQEWDGIRNYATMLFGFVAGLIRKPPANAYAYPNLQGMTDPARAAAIATWQDDYADGMLLPDLRYLAFQPARRHGFNIEQDEAPVNEDRPIPAILQAAAMLAEDTET